MRCHARTDAQRCGYQGLFNEGNRKCLIYVIDARAENVVRSLTKFSLELSLVCRLFLIDTVDKVAKIDAKRLKRALVPANCEDSV
jgi:hypothetical protein